MYRQTSGEQPALSRAAFTFNSDKYVFTLKARKIGGAEGFLIGFGATDANNDYWLNIGGWGNTIHAIEKKQGGGNRTILGQQIPGKVENDRWYSIRIEKNGDQYKCFLDDKLIRDFTETSNSKTAFAASTVMDKTTGDVIIKIVNVSPARAATQVELDLAQFNPNATKIVLTGDPKDTDTFENPKKVIPETSQIQVSKSFTYNAPPYSLTIIRVKPK